MKPLNERLKLIDEAIDELGGDPNNAQFFFCNFDFLWKAKTLGYCWATKESGSYKNEDVFCTRQEFERRVKEWRNLYEWTDKNYGSHASTGSFSAFLRSSEKKQSAKNTALLLGYDWQCVEERWKPKNTQEKPEWQRLPRVGEVITANFPCGDKGHQPRRCEVLKQGFKLDSKSGGELIVVCIEEDSPQYTSVAWIDEWLIKHR